MNPAGRIIQLPCYGITLTLARENDAENPGSGSIVSDLREPETAANRQYNAAIDGLESLILAHACAGVDVESPAYVEGIETAVDAIANRADPEENGATATDPMFGSNPHQAVCPPKVSDRFHSQKEISDVRPYAG
jgi:hypothetical protein